VTGIRYRIDIKRNSETMPMEAADPLAVLDSTSACAPAAMRCTPSSMPPCTRTASCSAVAGRVSGMTGAGGSARGSLHMVMRQRHRATGLAGITPPRTARALPGSAAITALRRTAA
jgi:hypothetical protein